MQLAKESKKWGNCVCGEIKMSTVTLFDVLCEKLKESTEKYASHLNLWQLMH